MLRLAAFAVTSALAAAAAGPLPPLPPLGRLLATPDRLTIDIANSGNPRVDGEYRLECRPVGGNHPEAEQACARLEELADAGENPFAPTPRGQMCTFQHGGRATARVTGTWRGHKVNTTFQREDGCGIARWKRLEPVLPGTGS
ncbi:subtilase-type protease inhibitor [Streptomyces sp. NBC_00249]|uniref:SSI family serine proteinase inhibitor n=1 Tax=Streptomyces sp. NBC_00249 TaxID=2975690 RepID=UPI002254D629|nr:SSI family serine proteinase inhibitor [Streptomyces sp. NBC_00249]MCX5196365.1 subtilase-type protease inhibitor [Streptomyces sp. NBC_00249]